MSEPMEAVSDVESSSEIAAAPGGATIGPVAVIGAALSAEIGLLIAALFGKFGIVSSTLSRWAVTLILGGACGNLIDRIRIGTVTDFLEFYVGTYYWPAFNVADSAIFCGAALLFVDYWMQSKRKPADPLVGEHVS